jgi:hypothetical protein
MSNALLLWMRLDCSVAEEPPFEILSMKDGVQSWLYFEVFPPEDAKTSGPILPQIKKANLNTSLA